MDKNMVLDCLLNDETIMAYYKAFNFSNESIESISNQLADIIVSRSKGEDSFELDDDNISSVVYDLRRLISAANDNVQLSSTEELKLEIMKTIVEDLLYTEEDEDIDPDFFADDPQFVTAVRETADWVVRPENFPNYCITEENKDQKSKIQLEEGEFDEDERDRMTMTMADGTILDLDEIWQYLRTLYSPEYED